MDYFRGLAASWQKFRGDPDPWVAVITGVDGAFRTGADPETTGAVPGTEGRNAQDAKEGAGARSRIRGGRTGAAAEGRFTICRGG